jgi:hypothetical protein
MTDCDELSGLPLEWLVQTMGFSWPRLDFAGNTWPTEFQTLFTAWNRFSLAGQNRLKQ